jgi:hypothetical protein
VTLSIPILALLTATLPPGEWRHAGTSLVSTYRYDYVINLWNYGPLYSVEGAEGVLDREQFIQGSLGGPDDWSPMFMPLQTEWGSRSWEYPTHDLPYCHRSTGEIRWVHESGLEKWTWYEGDIGAFTVERTRTWHETPATYVWGVFPIDNPE